MKLRFRLHIGLATSFALITLVLIGSIIGLLYVSASRLAVRTAAQSMDNAVLDVERSVTNLFVPVAKAVESVTFLVESGGLDFFDDQGQGFLFKKIQAMPELTAIFVAFEKYGEFHQVARVNGKNRPEVLPETVSGPLFAMRSMSKAPQASMTRYFSDWGQIDHEAFELSGFDPRERPWYQLAVDIGHVAISDPYAFASTGKPGVTVSQVAYTGAGEVLGVVAADITLAGLADYLEQKKVGQSGQVLIVDENRKVVARSGGSDSEHGPGDEAEAVLDHYWQTKDSNFTLPADQTVMASFKPFPPDFEKPWVIGIIADRTEFTREIRNTAIQVFWAALAYTLFAIAAMAFLSRRITMPLRRITSETRKIRDFQLDQDFALKSPIVEIEALAGAVESMKKGLRSFKAFVPVELVQSILATNDAVEIGGEHRELTLVFSDIQSFSAKSESMAPSSVFSDLSRYFGAIAETIRGHGGTVDKFIGDAVMAFWNAPNPVADHPAQACRAVLDCVHVCEQINAVQVDGHSLFPVRTRFGIHTGEVIVGNVGSNERMQYTALGSSVNLASRIEGLNKQYGTTVLMTEAVARQVSDQFLLRPVDHVQPAGISVPIRVYTLIGELQRSAKNPATDADKVLCSDWPRCLDLYESRKWRRAHEALEQFMKKYPEDSLAEVYLARCAEFETSPPSADWDGVYVYTKK